MFFLCGPDPKENEEDDGVVTVHIRGALEHHDEGAGGDCYDLILERASMAFASARAVVLRIDSPGGVVSGLNQCVFSLQRMKRDAQKPLYIYIDEMATSAAFALACAGDEVWLPPSGICGSVGVISSMISLAGANDKAGVQVVMIASGKRKTDGHPNAPITDNAIAAEQARVDDLAQQFFKIASKARGLSVETIEGYEAGLFLGRKAVKAGLADGVSGWAGFLDALG